MSDFRTLSDSVTASPQIAIADLDEAATAGVTTLICNRPEGEEPGQLTHAEIAAAAQERGMEFIAIPVVPGNFGEAHVEAMAAALANAEGKVLAYCRTGTRSTLLWSLVQARAGRDPDTVAAEAAAAGYDVAPVRPLMDMLAAQARD